MSYWPNKGCCNKPAAQCCPPVCCPPANRTRAITKWVEEQVPVVKTRIVMVNKEVCCPQNRLHTIEEEREVQVCVPVICKELKKIVCCVTENVEEETEVMVTVPVMTKEKRIAKIQQCRTVTEECEMEVCVPVTTYTEKEVCTRVVIPSGCNNCGTCNTCTSGCTNYGTEVRKIKVPCTTMERQVKKVPVCKQVTEVVDKEYEVCVCTTKSELRKVKTCKPVSRMVEKEIEVNVCKMETQTKIIKCPKQVYYCENIVRTIQVPERVTVTEYECVKRPCITVVDQCGNVVSSCAPQPACGVPPACAPMFSTPTSSRCGDKRFWTKSVSAPVPRNCNTFACGDACCDTSCSSSCGPQGYSGLPRNMGCGPLTLSTSGRCNVRNTNLGCNTCCN